MLSVKSISKSYDGKKILDNISFDVKAGEVVVLLGKSGVGKSTVIRLLNNLESADSGTFELNGKILSFSKVGMLFQDFNLFDHLTIQENITLPLIKVLNKSKIDAVKISDRLLDSFGLLSKKNSYPVSLSGGQKQRVALARTLATNPEVLCLDEPTSALDPALKSEAVEIISKLASQGFMIIITTHDPTLIYQLKSKIFLMNDGKIIETATVADLKNDENKFIGIKSFLKGK